MPRPTPPPPLSVTLTMLRSARGWNQKDLALASGIPNSILSDYETGRRTLSREKLERIATALKMGPEAIEMSLLALGFIQSQEEPPDSPLGLTEKERRAIKRAAAMAAREAANTTRTTLTRSFETTKIREAREEAEELWERLKRYSPRERRVFVESAREFQSWAFCERLCAESERAAAADAGRALDLADLALRVATQVPGGENWRSRVQGYAWAFVGNARRVASNLPGAEEAFTRAWTLWSSGNAGDFGILPEWRLLDLEASLRRGQRRLSEALDLLDRALGKGSCEEGRILLKKAFTLEQLGEYEQAIATLTTAANVVDDRSEPRLLCVLKFNLAVNLCHLGRHQQAQGLIPEIRELASRLGNELDLVRLLWLEGRITAVSGERHKAIAAMEHVRGEFISRSLAYDMALVSLELAVLYLEDGRAGEVRILARQMAPVFQAQGVPRETMVAIRLFCESAEKDAATVELARRLAEYLQRARYEPGLKFQP
jgi:transcriptional regulator with XRE-family HTH domain/tetratricopeptide (TPR) repeat protein